MSDKQAPPPPPPPPPSSEAQLTELPSDWRLAAIAQLNKKLDNPATCPVCGKRSSIVVASELVSPITLTKEFSYNLSSGPYPELAVFCRNCGFTRHFNYNLLMRDLPDENPEGDASVGA